MKILECSRGQIYDIGFIDPYWVHQANLKTNPQDTEDNIVHALRFQKPEGKYYFLTTSSECYCLVYTFYFAYSMLSI